MELLVELAANLFDAVFGGLFVMRFCGKKARNHPVCLLFMLLIFGVSTFFLFFKVHPILLATIVAAILFCCAALVCKEITLKTILGPIIFVGVLIASSTVLMFTISNLFKVNLSAVISEFGFHRCLFLFTCKILISSVLLTTAHFVVPGTKFRIIELVLYLLSPVVTMLLLSTLISVSTNPGAERFYFLIALSSLGLVITNALTMLFFNKSAKMEEEKHELQLLNQLSAAEQKRYSEMEQMYDTIRIIKHDLKEQLAYAESLFASGDTATAGKMLGELGETISNSNSVIHTGNRVLDNLLYLKSSLHPEIRFLITGTVCGIEELDEGTIVSLFSNLLDNAMEGCSDVQEKTVELELSLIAGFWNVICKNPISHSVLAANPSLATSKADPKLHGFGIKSMRKIVDSLHGMIEFYENGNLFCCHIALPIESE